VRGWDGVERASHGFGDETLDGQSENEEQADSDHGETSDTSFMDTLIERFNVTIGGAVSKESEDEGESSENESDCEDKSESDNESECGGGDVAGDLEKDGGSDVSEEERISDDAREHTLLVWDRFRLPTW
jgi:hypothetical protein